MKFVGWIGVVFGLLFSVGHYLENDPIDNLPKILAVLQAGMPTILLGVLFLLVDRRLSPPRSSEEQKNAT